jgi:hypothetical protein
MRNPIRSTGSSPTKKPASNSNHSIQQFEFYATLAVFDSTTSLLCTELVKDLAERNGWTNIEFKPVKVV